MKIYYLSSLLAIVMLTSCKAILINKVVNHYNEDAGIVFPDILVENESDSIIRFNSLKGNVVYLNFWGTWCTACLQEIPYLKELNNKVRNDRDIVVVNVCIESNRMEWKRMIREKEIAGMNFYMKEDSVYDQLQELLGITRTGIPNCRIINKDGVIVGSNLSPDQEVISLYALLEARKGVYTRDAGHNLFRLLKKMKKKDDAETKEFVAFLEKFAKKND